MSDVEFQFVTVGEERFPLIIMDGWAAVGIEPCAAGRVHELASTPGRVLLDVVRWDPGAIGARQITSDGFRTIPAAPIVEQHPAAVRGLTASAARWWGGGWSPWLPTEAELPDRGSR